MVLEGPLRERVNRALDEIRPALERDGGDISLVSVEDGVVVVKLLGACSRCPMARQTLADFVAERVMLYAPEITDVRQV